MPIVRLPTDPVNFATDYLVPRFLGVLGPRVRVRKGPADITPGSIDLAQEEADAREQQAIADAVEGIIP